MRTCSGCAFWVRAEADEGDLPGVCRRNPPTLFVLGMSNHVDNGRNVSIPLYNSAWPATGPDAWCGEWALRPLESGQALPDLRHVAVEGIAQ